MFPKKIKKIKLSAIFFIYVFVFGVAVVVVFILYKDIQLVISLSLQNIAQYIRVQILKVFQRCSSAMNSMGNRTEVLIIGLIS